MSHLTTVQTQIKDMCVLDSVLKSSFSCKSSGSKVVHGYHQQKTAVDIAWEIGGKNYDIGAVKQSDGTYTLVADWMMAGINQQEILQQYSIKNALRRAKLLGHQVVKQESQSDGSIRLVIKTKT
jgi:ketol-acid reductoisomerase